MSNETNHQQAQMLRGTAWLTASNFILTWSSVHHSLVYLDGNLCGKGQWPLYHGV